MVAFFITVGASIYIATSSEISASTTTNKTVAYTSVAITNYLDATMPANLWKCAGFRIEYIVPTTPAGPSGQLSSNTVISTYRNDIYSAFKTANPSLVFYEGQAEIKADIDKCAKGNDSQACTRVKKGVLKTALKPECDSLKPYDTNIVNPNVIYGAASAPSSATSNSSNETKNFSIVVTDENQKGVADAEVTIAIPSTNGGTQFNTCITSANGKCAATIKDTAKIDTTKKLTFFAILLDGSKTQNVEKLWQDIKNNDTITLIKNTQTDSTAPLPANEPNNPFQVPGTESLTGAVRVINSKTKRVLGGVYIEIQSANDAANKATTTTQDPPKPEGESIEQFSKGSYALVAKRYGYEIYQTTLNVTSASQYFNIDIPMVPLAGLPNPDLQFQSALSSSLTNSNLSNLGGGTIPLINQLLQYVGQNGTGSVLSDYPYQNGYPNSTTPLGENIYGQNIWTGQTVVDSQIRSYNVFQYTDGRYYLVNSAIGSTDIKPIQFIMSQGSTGGLAFVSAASGLNVNASSQSGWYVTTFTLSNNKPVIDRFKLSRVDISPSDYATAINSQITDGFNGITPTLISGNSGNSTENSSLVSGVDDLRGVAGNENYKTPAESNQGGQGMAKVIPIGQWNLDSGPDSVWGQSKDPNIPSSPQRAFSDSKYPSGTYVIAIVKWHAINNETDRQNVYKLIPADFPSASIRCSFNGSKTLACGQPSNSSQVEIFPMYNGVVKGNDYWAITVRGLFSEYSSTDKGYWFIKRIA